MPETTPPTTARWELSPAAQLADANMRALIPYTGGGTYDPAACVHAPTPQSLALARIIKRIFPWVRPSGDQLARNGLRCSAGSDTTHNIGRALDVMVPVDAGHEGEALANWLVEHASELGIQLVIWNHSAWQPSFRNAVLPASRRLTPYRLTETDRHKSHRSHVHVEVTAVGAPLLLAQLADTPLPTTLGVDPPPSAQPPHAEIPADGPADMTFTVAESEQHQREFEAAQRAVASPDGPSTLFGSPFEFIFGALVTGAILAKR